MRYAIYKVGWNIVLSELRNGAPVVSLLVDGDTPDTLDACISALCGGDVPLGGRMFYGLDAAKIASRGDFAFEFSYIDGHPSVIKENFDVSDGIGVDWMSDAR